MGTPSENQQYKKPQAPPPEIEDNDSQKQGVKRGKKVWPADEETEDNADTDIDDGDSEPE